jgi:hypothetical protein
MRDGICCQCLPPGLSCRIRQSRRTTVIYCTEGERERRVNERERETVWLNFKLITSFPLACPPQPITRNLSLPVSVGLWCLSGAYKTSYRWRMSSSGMLRRVSLVRTGVSEEHIAFIIRVTRIGELGIALTVTGNRSKLRRNISISVNVTISISI